MKNLKHLFTALLLLCTTMAAAHDFEVGGIYYKILSEEDKTVEVTYKGTSYSAYSNEYTGSVVIPETVTVSETGTTVLKTYDAWTSTNKGNGGTTSQTSYTLNVEAGQILKFDWSVSSESNYDWLTITLDGTEIVNKSGVQSGSYEKTFTTAGTHTLVVKYSKDGSVNNGNDEGKIYNIALGIAKDETDSLVYRVASIGNNAFFGCSSLVSVVIPNSVTTIGGYSFNGCSSLASVVIPNSVTRIGARAFYECKSLAGEVVIPNSVESIGRETFEGCKKLSSLVIGNGVVSIGERAFFNCSGVTDVVIGENVKTIGDYAFYGWNSIKKIEHNSKFVKVFPINEGSLEEVVIGYGVTCIPERAFESCTNLKSITIPNSVKSIGYAAFQGCTNLANVVIPNSITSVERYAFSGTAWYNNQPDGVVYVGKVLFKYKGTMPENTSIIVEDGVCSISGEAFYGCSGLTSIEIPASVTSIGESAFYNTAWYNNQPDGVIYIEDFLYAYKGSMPYNTSIIVKDGTLCIAGGAFNSCQYLRSITIPNSVTSIGDNAFSYCTGLTSVVIPNSVTSIGEWAFASCTGLTSIEIPSSVTSIGGSAFYGCISLTSITIGNSVTSIGGSAFYGCTGLTSITIPNSVTSIGDYAFASCSGLTSITIPNSVTSIGDNAFSYCTGLTSVVIPNSVTSIGEWAFGNCSGLTSIEIPKNVTSIGRFAFYGCSGLKSVTSLIPADKLFEISSDSFNYSDIPCLYVPYGAKETYVSTAYWSYFPHQNIVELEPVAEVTVTINQYGCATYCSEYALDFSNVEGLKAYAATGYKSNSQVVTLTRVQTAEAGIGLFLKAEPGEYVVPVIESTDEHSLNMLVGVLEETVVNSTEGNMSNYKFIISDVDNAPMFCPFEDNTTFSAGEAYLQIPTAWLPSVAQKSVSIRFDEGEFTDIDEVEGESGEVKTVYDLQGRVVENPTNGIYIINGKKVLIK